MNSGEGTLPGGQSPLWQIGRSALTAMLALLMAAAFSPCALAGSDVTFPCPTSIEPNVQFWVDVFANYSERDFIVHDRDQVWHVYQVMHLPGAGAPGRDDVAAVNSYLKTKYANMLNRLAGGAKPVDVEEQRVANMFKGQPLSAYTLAADNLRVQQGMREQFRDGLLRSRNYRSTMERIFRSFDLPPELVTLAGVESGFYSRARSSAGAVGIWQFTRGTGREYMRISRYHDDRLNPIAETRAAAQLLRANYAELGSWPLAITAYNYGTAGMAQAAAQYNSDYSKIIRDYNGPHFGFATKNYYAEFLAALEVHQHEDKYFPALKYMEAPTPPLVRTALRPRMARHTRHSRVHHRRHRIHHHREVAAAKTQTDNRSDRHARVTTVVHHSDHHRHRVTSARARQREHRGATMVADDQSTGQDS
ncbi:MAG: lytic transglycosylase domain-containing protein [Candidatus Binataceae bacterium]